MSNPFRHPASPPARGRRLRRDRGAPRAAAEPTREERGGERGCALQRRGGGAAPWFGGPSQLTRTRPSGAYFAGKDSDTAARRDGSRRRILRSGPPAAAAGPLKRALLQFKYKFRLQFRHC